MTRTLSTAEARRAAVTAAAVRAFARGGFRATTVADVAREASISPAYVSKLFPTKERLFAAALDACFDQILDALEAGAERAADATPESVLDAMATAYADLIADRTLLLMQVHAQSVTGTGEIGTAFRQGLGRVVTFARSRSRAPDAAVQRFMAYGQLCHLLVAADIDQVPDDWARLLSAGMYHSD